MGKLLPLFAIVATLALAAHAEVLKCATGKNTLVCSGNGRCGTFKAGANADGTEEDQTCFCKPGWRGPACGVRTCEDDCGVHGVCKHRAAPKPYCLCDKGWGLDKATGKPCAREVCPGTSMDGATVCTNGQGICRMGPAVDEKDAETGKPVQKLVCYCQPGYYGTDCSIPVGKNNTKKQLPTVLPEGDYVENGTVKNRTGGIETNRTYQDEVDNAKSRIRCRMKDDETGEERDMCEGQGQCKASLDGTYYKCECNATYGGDFCQERSCHNNCYDHGRCNLATGKCTCTEPYYGENCEFKRCTNGTGKDGCSGNGKCDKEEGVCKCNKGFMSDDGCKERVCNSKTCDEEGGKCEGDGAAAKCVCNPGYTSRNGSTVQCKDFLCSTDCHYNGGENSQGFCTAHGKCECYTGWSGEDCNAPKMPTVADVGSACDEDCPAQCAEEFSDKCEFAHNRFTLTWDQEKKSSVKNEVPSTTPEKKTVELTDLLIDPSNWTLLPTPPNADGKMIVEARTCFLKCVKTCLAPCQKELMGKNERQRDEVIESFKPNSLPAILNMTGHIPQDAQSDQINEEEYNGKRVIYNRDITEENSDQSTEGEIESRGGNHPAAPERAGEQTPAPPAPPNNSTGAGEQQFKAIGSRLEKAAGSNNRNNVRVEDVEARAEALGAMAAMFP